MNQESFVINQSSSSIKSDTHIRANVHIHQTIQKVIKLNQAMRDQVKQGTAMPEKTKQTWNIYRIYQLCCHTYKQNRKRCLFND